jgi:hypothetical protein
MRKLVMLLAAASIGYAIRRVTGKNPDPGHVNVDNPEPLVDAMQRSAGAPVRP